MADLTQPNRCSRGNVKKRGRPTLDGRQQWHGRFIYTLPPPPGATDTVLPRKNVEVYGWSQREAWEKMEARKREIESGKHLPPEQKDAWTLDDLFVSWLRSMRNIAPRTRSDIERYTEMLRLLLGGDTPVEELLADVHLDERLNMCLCCRPRKERPIAAKPDEDCERCEGTGIKGSTTAENQIGALNQAIKWGWAKAHKLSWAPFYRVDPFDPAGKAREFDDDELRKLLAAVADSPQWLAFYHLAIFRGMRLGEILRLRWTDRLEPDVLFVGKSKTKAGVRKVTLNRKSAHLLDLHRADQIRRGYTGEMLFPSAEGAVLTPHNFRARYFWKLLDQPGLNLRADRPFQFHSFRHTAFTRGYDQEGVDKLTLLIELGHKPSRTNMPGEMGAATPTYIKHVASRPIDERRRAQAEVCGAPVDALLHRKLRAVQ